MPGLFLGVRALIIFYHVVKFTSGTPFCLEIAVSHFTNADSCSSVYGSQFSSDQYQRL